MIRVERRPAPSWVKDREFRAARDSYAQFRAEGGARTKQTTMDFASAFGPYLPLAADYAYKLFHGKCAYTEVPAEMRLHLHRPEYDAFDERKPSSPNHYWWTAAWYRNWYIASHEVEALKRNNFPVIGDRAAEPRPNQLRGGEVPSKFLDRGVLLDPCEDYPQLHLDFQLDGTVRPWGERLVPWLDEVEPQRAIDTIRLLDLNSPGLVEGRAHAIRAALALLDKDDPSLWALLGPEAPYAGAMRQAVAARLVESGVESLSKDQRLVIPELVPRIAASPDGFGTKLATQVRRALQGSHPRLADVVKTRKVEVSSLAPDRAATRRPQRGLTASETRIIPRTAAITRVLITNFQSIERYELVIPPGVESVAPNAAAPAAPVPQASTEPDAKTLADTTGPANRPWRVLLGENGSGKSSALRAIALALATTSLESLRVQCKLEWGDVVRRGTKQARVLLEFTGGGTIDLRITKDRATFYGGAPRMEGYVRGFGATRLTSDEDTTAAANVRLGNLFDPRQPVVDAEKWLLDLERNAAGDFNVTAVTIARLLSREDQVVETRGAAVTQYIKREGEEITVGDEPMRTISDGYRAIISMACELMAGAGSGLSDIRNASGIVLVDELGSYLHPRWKMQITRTMRTEFPSMQFLVTTHEPLCLRGLVEREVVLVKPSVPDPDGRWSSTFETIEESPSRFRVDQLLTSAFFGLGSTIDPVVEQEFAKYYALIRKPVLTPAEETERERLRGSLSGQGVLGYTARDQLVYEAIDEFLADKQTDIPNVRPPDPRERRERRSETLRTVADIWRNVAANRDSVRQP